MKKNAIKRFEKFTVKNAVSVKGGNAPKNKHDTAKASISNVR